MWYVFDAFYQYNIIHFKYLLCLLTTKQEYDDPSIFAGKTVLCVGGRASGSDLAREISLHADHVYLSDTTCELEGGKPKSLGKVTWVSQ